MVVSILGLLSIYFLISFTARAVDLRIPSLASLSIAGVLMRRYP